MSDNTYIQLRYYVVVNTTTASQAASLAPLSLSSALVRVWIVDPLNQDATEGALTALTPSTVST